MPIASIKNTPSGGAAATSPEVGGGILPRQHRS